MDIKKQVEEFRGLPYETKRTKVLEVLKQLQWTHEIFTLFYKTVSSFREIPEQILLFVYQSVFEIANAIKQWNKSVAEEKTKKIGEILMSIKKQEEMEREKEESPDALLQNI